MTQIKIKTRELNINPDNDWADEEDVQIFKQIKNKEYGVIKNETSATKSEQTEPVAKPKPRDKRRLVQILEA